MPLYHFSSLLKRVLTKCPKRCYQLSSAYSTKATLKTIGEKLMKFDGGSVDLKLIEETGMAIMTMNNPGRLNSMTGKMMVDMANHISFLETWSKGKALILMGSDGAFCSGGDFRFVENAFDSGEDMALFQHDALTRLHNLSLVSIALLQGYALGGGAELSTACDFRVMSQSAKVGFINMKMGVTTGWGASTRLVHLVGRQKALHLLMSSKIFTADEGHKYGLVDYILQPSLSSEEELADCKRWVISNYCKHSSEMTQSLKSSIVFCDANRDMNTSLHEERKVFLKFWGSQRHKDAFSDAKKK